MTKEEIKIEAAKLDDEGVLKLCAHIVKQAVHDIEYGEKLKNRYPSGSYRQLQGVKMQASALAFLRSSQGRLFLVGADPEYVINKIYEKMGKR